MSISNAQSSNLFGGRFTDLLDRPVTRDEVIAVGLVTSVLLNSSLDGEGALVVLKEGVFDMDDEASMSNTESSPAIQLSSEVSMST